MSSTSKIIFLCLAAALACSCSRFKLAYSYADWLLLRQAHQYMVLNPDAEAALAAEIGAYHAWHRKEMLPAYAALCRKLARGFRGQERDEDNVAQATPMLSTLWSDTLEPMISPLAGALESMDEKGIARLEAAYAKDSARQRKLYLDDPAGAQKRRIQKTLAYVEDFSGPLSPAQKEAIGALAAGIPMPYALWVADRERRKQELIAILKAHKGEAAIEAALRDWWLKSRVSQGAPAEGQMDVRELKRFFLGTLRALTAAQREAAALKLEAYAGQFEELSRDSKEKALK